MLGVQAFERVVSPVGDDAGCGAVRLLTGSVAPAACKLPLVLANRFHRGHGKLRDCLHLRLCLLAALIGVVLVSAAHASTKQSGTVYTGMLGPHSVVMEIDAREPSHVTGRYFYARYHRDLMLDGRQVTADHLHLFEGRDDATDRSELELVRQPDGGWSGSWRDANGREFDLVLRPAAVSAPQETASPYLKWLARAKPYEYLRLHGLSLRRGRRQTFLGHQLQWWTEPETKLTLFQVVDGYSAPQRERINAALMGRLWVEVSAFFSCMAGDSVTGGDFEQTVTPRLLSADIVSVSVFTSYYCGGAHPDFGDTPINLDARTGRVLSLEDVLWVGKGKPFHYVDDDESAPASSVPVAPNTVDFDAYAHYRSAWLAPWLVRQLGHLYPKNMTPVDEDKPGYDYPDAWQFPSWYMTPTGIFFGPSFARAARAAEAEDDWSVLPYAAIRPHPGGVKLSLP